MPTSRSEKRTCGSYGTQGALKASSSLIQFATLKELRAGGRQAKDYMRGLDLIQLQW
jgi:hypothetical protein